MRAVLAWGRDHTLAVDTVIAVAWFGLALLSVRIYHDIGAVQPHNFRFAIGVACAALLTLPLALRRRWPAAVLVCAAVAVLGYTIWGVTDSVEASAVFVAIYTTGAYASPRVANVVRAACIALMFGCLLWILLARQIDVGHSKASVVGAGLLSVGNNLFFFVVAWVTGDVARASRLRAAEVAQRNAELEVAQGTIAEQAVLDERVRIAREVHDVVAHHVSVMGVQAGAARRVMARDPDQAAEVLSAVEASSRQAVAELQRLLGFLRSAPAEGETVDAPQPTLARLDPLLAQFNDAGLRVSAVVEGEPRPLPPSVDLSAYRVIQEALTNALKHGGTGTMATVTLGYSTDSLELSVVDDGRGRANGRTDNRPLDPVPSTGHGLVGMRERVALHGGRFEAQHRRGSGFEVKATFPLSAPFRTAS
jgi:signal transduction histidine kinase